MVGYSVAQYSVVQCSIVQCGIVWMGHSVTQFSIVQYSVAQCDIVQYSVVQDSMVFQTGYWGPLGCTFWFLPRNYTADSNNKLISFDYLNQLCSARGKLNVHPQGGLQDRVLWETLQHSIVQYSIVQYSIVQYSIEQHSIAQYSIAQYSIVQYSIVNMAQFPQGVICFIILNVLQIYKGGSFSPFYCHFPLSTRLC